MLYTLKPLVVVLGIALVVFMLARPWCQRFMAAEDYARRRNVWIALTLTAFASPSFWIYAAVALVLLAWAAHRDSNPLALYVAMLHVIPPIGLDIPMVGINQFFQLNNYRILSLVVLLPLAVRIFRSPQPPASRTRVLMDSCVVGFVLLQLVLLIPYESFTNTLRRGFLLTLDIVLVYYTFSRACITRRIIHDVMAALCLSCAVFATLAVFETAKGWLLYEALGDVWGKPIEFAFLLRGDSLRAQASLGHSILLGYTLAMGFSFMLCLAQTLNSRTVTLVLAGWLWLGMLASYSRGPWLAAAICFFTFVALQRAGAVRFVKYGFVAVVGAAGLLLSPWGGRVIASLPVVGTVDLETVEYRRRLAEVSWELIQQHPLLGNPFVLTQMEELRQGQGIIDLVNSYASIALLYGVPGLLLFVGVFAGALWTAWRMQRRGMADDAEVASLGACIIGCLLGTLMMLTVASFIQGLAWTSWVLAGLAAAYGNLQDEPEPLPEAPPLEVPPARPAAPARPGGWVRPTGI